MIDWFDMNLLYTFRGLFESILVEKACFILQYKWKSTWGLCNTGKEQEGLFPELENINPTSSKKIIFFIF